MKRRRKEDLQDVYQRGTGSPRAAGGDVTVPEQIQAALGLVLVLVREGLLDLSKLGPHPGVLGVAVRVQPGQGLQALGLAAVVHQPARALGEEHDQQGQHHGGHDLDAQRHAPLGAAGDAEGADAQPAGDEGADAQHELLQRSDAAADARVRNLALVDGDDHDEEADAQPSEAPPGPQVRDGLRARLQGAAQDEDQAADEDGQAPAEPVTGRAGEEGTEEGATREEGDNDATGGARLVGRC